MPSHAVTRVVAVFLAALLQPSGAALVRGGPQRSLRPESGGCGSRLAAPPECGSRLAAKAEAKLRVKFPAAAAASALVANASAAHTALHAQPPGQTAASVAQPVAAQPQQPPAQAAAQAAATTTFQQWYEWYSTGRGIWKWSNALDAYQRHFGMLHGIEIKLCEVGVQSGGSINMWHDVLGQSVHVYGVDINKATKAFEDQRTTIIIGDQGDVAMWQDFYALPGLAGGQLDILVDDGSHEAEHMLVTLMETWKHLQQGGSVSIEDIHGAHYLQSFFAPAAQFLGYQAQSGAVEAVHVYPFLLMVQAPGQREGSPKSELTFAGTTTTVADFDGLWAAVPQHPGGHIILENEAWGPFTSPSSLTSFFTHFNDLHTSAWYDVPSGCQHTSDPVCTNIVRSNPMQLAIVGIHIYPKRLVVEVAGGPLILQAVRRGTEWIDYE